MVTINHQRYAYVLCTACAAIVDVPSNGEYVCGACGSTISVLPESDVYRYSEAAIYYGYQYRKLYERQRKFKDKSKPSLAFFGDAFTFIAVAALSGIIGGIAYDAVKGAMRHVHDQARQRASTRPDFRKLAELSDEDLDRIFEYTKEFTQGLANLEKTLRDDIMEEMMADRMANAVCDSPELLERFAGGAFTKEDEEQFVEMLKTELSEKPASIKPAPSAFEGFWNSVKNDDQ